MAVNPEDRSNGVLIAFNNSYVTLYSFIDPRIFLKDISRLHEGLDKCAASNLKYGETNYFANSLRPRQTQYILTYKKTKTILHFSTFEKKLRKKLEDKRGNV